MNIERTSIASSANYTELAGRLGMLFLVFLLMFVSEFVSAQTSTQQTLNQGKQLAFERKKGNCLACHLIDGGTLMGNNGPPLVAMKQRFPDREKLIQQISDARVKNPSTIMPPFGTHGILTRKEIELISDWLLTL
jgi:L-cysteine S-thiosulfotransferase